TASSNALTPPESSSRNLHTLPLTSGGSAQTNVSTPRTTPVSLPRSDRIDATTNPITRFDTNSVALTPMVRRTASHRPGAAKISAKLSQPTNCQSPTILLGPTLLNAIWKSTTSGYTAKTASSATAGNR